MSLWQRLSDWHSGRFGSWTVGDPRPIAEESPYTFYLPSAEVLEAIAIGDLIKALFRAVPANRDFGAERMWVKVTAIDGDILIGELDNDPVDMPQLRAGTVVRVPRSHVIGVEWGSDREVPQHTQRRWYWDRCMVDDCVLEGRSKIDFLYRDEPDLTREGDEDPDSGWRIRGTQHAIDEDAATGREPVYVALGKVLNADDRWLHLIDEPVGEAFQWWEEERRFVRLAPE